MIINKSENAVPSKSHTVAVFVIPDAQTPFFKHNV